MSPNPVFQPSMAGGELAPSLYGRVDLARYSTSLKLCRNFIVQVYGGVKNRPGTRMVAEVKDSSKRVRLIPFVFNQDQAYVLELGHRYLRAFTDGGQLMGVTNRPNYGGMKPTQTGAGTFTLTAELDTFVPGDVGRKVKISTSGFYEEFTITGYTSATVVDATSTADHTGITPAFSAYWMFFDNPVGTVVFETNTPWDDTDLPDLVYAQSADVMTVCHPDHAPQDIRRLTDGTFDVRPTTMLNGPFLPVNTDKTATVVTSGTEGTITITASAPIFKADSVGRLFYMEPAAYGKPWEPGVTVAAGDIRSSDGKFYKAKSGGTTGLIAPTHFNDKASDGKIDWLYLHSGFGVCEITAVGALTDGKTRTATATTQGIIPENLVNTSVGSLLTVTSFTISPADATRVRVVTSVAHGLVTDDSVSYVAHR